MKRVYYKKGYSLIETIAYATVMTILVAVIAYATNALFIAHKKIKVARQIENSALASLDRMVRDIRAASDIDLAQSAFGVDNGYLTLTIPESSGSKTVKFYLSGGKVMVADVVNGIVTPIGQVSLSGVSVTSLKFTNLTGSTHSKAIKIEMVVVGAKGQDLVPTNHVYYNNLDNEGAAGKILGARTFNGGSPITGDYVQLGDTFTYALWMKRSNTNVNLYQTLLSKGSNSAALVLMGETNPPDPLYPSQVAMSKYFVPDGDVAFSQAKITDTAWHHIAMTKSGSTRNIYIDGVPSTILDTDRTMDNVNSAMIIGLGFEGTIDDVRVYNYALTEEQVNAIYKYTGLSETFYATAVMRGSYQ